MNFNEIKYLSELSCGDVCEDLYTGEIYLVIEPSDKYDEMKVFIIRNNEYILAYKPNDTFVTLKD
jgi:hypothetical protein